MRRKSGAPLHRFGGFSDRRNDSWVGAASADVAVERTHNFLPGGVWGFAQQGDACHNHPAGTVSALHRSHFEEGLLKGMKLAVPLQRFSGGNAPPSDASRGGYARPDGHPIREHGASSALALTASILGPGEAKVIPEDAEEGT